MDGLERDPETAAAQPYDIVVVGGGVYGVMILYEAARRGLSGLLLERDDFGGATSQNNFRILHGGLRYLQSLDLGRFRESVVERRWFLRRFPDLAFPMSCLMPLYQQGARRRSVLRLALVANDTLSLARNRSLAVSHRLHRSRLVTRDETLTRFPEVRQRGLAGSALWADACMPWPQRILMETLRDACAAGARALNYCVADRLDLKDRRVRAVIARDRLSGIEHCFRTRAVINATGPWGPDLADRFGGAGTGLYWPTLAWNVLFDRPAPSEGAVAVSGPRPDAQVLFLLPWQGRLLAGTGHASWQQGTVETPAPEEAQLVAFIGALNEAAPRLDLRLDEVHRVYAGLLPGRGIADQRLRGHPIIRDHRTRNGPTGLWSVSGVKFTTARRVAADLLARLAPGRAPSEGPRDARSPPRGIYGPDWRPTPDDEAWQEDLRRIAAEEAVVHLDDLLLRRTSLGDDWRRAVAVAPLVARALGWGDARRDRELLRLRRVLMASGVPGAQLHAMVAGPGQSGGLTSSPGIS